MKGIYTIDGKQYIPNDAQQALIYQAEKEWSDAIKALDKASVPPPPGVCVLDGGQDPYRDLTIKYYNRVRKILGIHSNPRP